MPRPAGAMRTCLLFFLMTAPLTLAMDRQLDDCTSSKPCWKNYRGTCRDDVRGCDEDESDVGRVGCEDDCQCCGCGNDAMKNDCKDAGGHCVPDGEDCCGEVQPKWCRGKKCFCCIPGIDIDELALDFPDPCNDFNGICEKEWCTHPQFGIQASCPESEVCCVDCLLTTPECVRRDGACAPKCPAGYGTVPNICHNNPGENCTCCTYCPQTVECTREGDGKAFCARECPPDWGKDGSMCTKDDCFCCLPPTTDGSK